MKYVNKVNYTVEGDKITEILINGKPKAARDLRKAQATDYWVLFTENQVCENPFSGVEVELNPVEASIYNFCVAWYSRYQRGINPQAPVQVYDSMRYLILDMNSDAYYDLLD